MGFQVSSTVRRLGLHVGVPDRPVLCRFASWHDLWWSQRNHEGAHCQADHYVKSLSLIKENPKPFKLTILPNQIFNELMRRKQDKDLNIFDLEQSDSSYSLSDNWSYSSPNLLYSQVYENNSLKPTISIKYKQFENKFGHHKSWDQLGSKTDVFDNVNVTSNVKFDEKNQNQNNKFHYECYSIES